uniref:Uncharacterized protein n=1 Tax=Cacopsylla melanoneura TaxID=428564 RepID=A0A8D8W6Z0_9HEMI
MSSRQTWSWGSPATIDITIKRLEMTQRAVQFQIDTTGTAQTMQQYQVVDLLLISLSQQLFLVMETVSWGSDQHQLLYITISISMISVSTDDSLGQRGFEGF